MHGDDNHQPLTPPEIGCLVDELSEKYADLKRMDINFIVMSTIDNYFSKDDLVHFFEKNVEKLKLPVVMRAIRGAPDAFFYIESHFREENTMYHLLEDIPLEKVRTMETYSPDVFKF